MTPLILIWLGLGAVSFMLSVRGLVLGRRVKAALELPSWTRNTARRVFFRGVIGAPAKALPVVARYRMETLVYLLTVAVFFLWFLGAPAIIGLLALGVIAALTKPIDCTGTKP